MIINQKADKESLKNQFFALIRAKGLSFRRFCFLHNLDYDKEYRICFNKKYVDTQNIQNLVDLIDKKMKVHIQNEKWVISKPY